MAKRLRIKAPAGNEVGYAKPPRESQFKKGRSGNPKGRPRGSLNIATVLARALRKQVIVKDGGRRRKITKLEAAVTQIVNKAASGEPGSIRFLIGLTQVVEAEVQAHDTPTELPEDDRKVMEGFLARLQKLSLGSSDGKA